MVYNFFDKKHLVEQLKLKLAKELHKAIIRKIEKRKVHSSFIDKVCGADLENIQLISKFNKEFLFL